MKVWVAIAAAWLAWSGEARACTNCSCGVPTLTASGSEVPFEGRLRFSSAVRGWGENGGTEGIDAQQVRELRMDLGASYAVLSWLVLSATLPVQARQLRTASLARESSVGLGDVSLGARAVVWKDRSFAPSFLVSALLGASIPTGPLQRTPDGTPLSLDAQLGMGGVEPGGGLSLSHFRGAYSFFAWAYGTAPWRGFLGYQPGASLRGAVAVQYQPSPRWAIRGGPEILAQKAGDLSGLPDDHQGTIFFAGADGLFAVTPEVLVQLGVRLPVFRTSKKAPLPLPVVAAALFVDL